MFFIKNVKDKKRPLNLDGFIKLFIIVIIIQFNCKILSQMLPHIMI